VVHIIAVGNILSIIFSLF